MSTLSSIKAANQAKEQEEKRNQERKRNALVLILRHLADFGYRDTAERLVNESGISFEKWDVADNVDLLSIIQEYEDFYEFKFDRKPKLVRKASGIEDDSKKPHLPKISSRPRSGESRKPPSGPSPSPSANTASSSSGMKDRPTGPSLVKKDRKPSDSSMGSSDDDFSTDGLLIVKKTDTVSKKGVQDRKVRDEKEEGHPDEYFRERLIKPLPDPYNAEMRDLAMSISRDIIVENPDVRWDDIVELDSAKRLLKEAVVIPMRFPQFFTGLLAPWRGILLYGPPGTGKTMLAKAVATECRTTFFNISASSIVSKWRGDSEKLVRVLFDLAWYHRPSTIFLDEIDAIMSDRDAGPGEHEASRRMKTELLIQMDGLTGRAQNGDVFVLAASNLPWALDPAFLRRLEKRILVGLPTELGRQRILEKHLGPRSQGLNFQQLAERTQGYSGSDLVLVCKESAMRPLRRLFASIESGQISADDPSALVLDSVTNADVNSALETTHPSAQHLEHKYIKFQKECGSV